MHCFPDCSRASCGLGDALVFLGATLHSRAGASRNAVIRASYHAAYRRQRTNLFTLCPPATALTLPEHIRRLIGYFKPGPVLNKLYCGSGNSEILTAFTNYGSGARPIDWAGPAALQPQAQHWARLCGLELCTQGTDGGTASDSTSPSKRAKTSRNSEASPTAALQPVTQPR